MSLTQAEQDNIINGLREQREKALMNCDSMILMFMGYTEHDHGSYKTYEINDRHHFIHSFDFRNNWEHLMDVVEYIEKLSLKTEYQDIKYFRVLIEGKFCAIKCYEDNRQPGYIFQTPYGDQPPTKAEAVLHGIVYFIKWYNETLQ